MVACVTALRGLEDAAAKVSRASHSLEWLQIVNSSDSGAIDATRAIVVRALYRASKDLGECVAELVALEGGAQ
jgi:hypothetical protein